MFCVLECSRSTDSKSNQVWRTWTSSCHFVSLYYTNISTYLCTLPNLASNVPYLVAWGHITWLQCTGCPETNYHCAKKSKTSSRIKLLVHRCCSVHCFPHTTRLQSEYFQPGQEKEGGRCPSWQERSLGQRSQLLSDNQLTPPQKFPPFLPLECIVYYNWLYRNKNNYFKRY